VAFANYAKALTGITAPVWAIAVVVLGVLTIINCFGVRSGANTQTVLMLLKLAAIVMLIAVGLTFSGAPSAGAVTASEAPSLLSFAAAMTPVMFAYGGWQTASFMSAELRQPRRDLAIGLLAGVAGVITVYLLTNMAYLRALGPSGLAETTTPASSVMRLAMGERGAMLIAAGIAISTLGFLSQGMLTAPRVYYAMAEDGLFFRRVAQVSPVTRVPVMAILLQGAAAAIIALSGTFGQILSYVVSVDFIFFGLTGAALFVFRRRDGHRPVAFKVPLHPLTTVLFVGACALTVVATVWNNLANSLIGYAILLAGVPACLYWQSKNRRTVA
jgi:APA family basic amino acid/polyamine antiporter